MFSTELNKTAWAAKRALGCTWGEAVRLAIKLAPLPQHGVLAPTGVLGTWTPASLRNVAEYFWEMGNAYKTIGDNGRSFSMKKVSSKMFSALEMNIPVTLPALIKQKGVGGVESSTFNEMISFFISSATGIPTERMDFLNWSSKNNHKIPFPRWSF